MELKEALRRVELIQQRISPSYTSPRSNRSGVNRLAFMMGLVACILYGIAGVLVYFNEKTIGSSEKVAGTIVRLERNGSGFTPVVEYEYDGILYHHTSSVSSSPPAFDAGEKVEVFVNTSNPADIVINTFSERWLASVIVGGIGTVFLLFTILFARFFKS